MSNTITAWPSGTGTATTTGGTITVNNGTFGGLSNFTVASSYITASSITIDTAHSYAVPTIPDALRLGEKCNIKLPDGSRFVLKADGNHQLIDKDAKITYKANTVRAFNRYINASDLVAEFIDDLRKLGMPQDRVLQVPIELFVNWLMIRSAEADGEEPSPEVPRLESKLVRSPRCGCCGRFIPHRNERAGMRFCNGTHADLHLNNSRN